MFIENNKIFVTVGTTSFDRLIETVCSKELQHIFKELGYTSIDIQLGNGTFIPPKNIIPDFNCNWYRYKNNIDVDIKQASLVISHAGAGSTIEVLEANKKLIVVLNENLMDNHQAELAYKMYQEKYLFYSTCKNLASDIKSFNFENTVKYIPGNPKIFVEFMNDYFSIT